MKNHQLVYLLVNISVLILLVVAGMLLHRYKKLESQYLELRRSTFLPKMEANAVELEEQVFHALLPYKLHNILPQGGKIFGPSNYDGVLFAIVTSSVNCLNGLETDIQELNRIYLEKEGNVIVQGFHLDDQTELFVASHHIKFPVEKASSEGILLNLGHFTTPLVLAFNVGTDTIIGVHNPIPDDTLKSHLFYKRFGL